MFRQSLRPVLRSGALRSNAIRQPARFNSTQGPKPGNESASDSYIPAIGVAAIVLGGLAYYYVPLKHDLDDRAIKKVAKPDTLKALSPHAGNVSRSVLDQDSLKQPLHKSSHGVTPSAKDTGAVPDVVEKKAQEANEPAQTAFNEETGEINWDCPCLGGMADGPCGEEFKAAFSCFVYSDKEPKGVECVEKFQGMQDCFRKHPDIYGEEIDDDDDESAPSGAAVDPRPDSQKNRKMEAVSRTPPPDLPHHKMTQENSVKGVAKLVPSKKRADKTDEPGNTSSGENTVPKEQKSQSS